MEMNSISLPSSDANIAIVRKFACEKGFSLHKVPNEELWNLKDSETKETIKEHESLMNIHDYLCHCDD